MGILGGTVKNLDVVMSPSQEINRNWENVIKFPQVGMALIKYSRKIILLQHPIKTNAIATVGFIVDHVRYRLLNEIGRAHV